MVVDNPDWREFQRRIDATIARASACHMSNAKWRKLFMELRQVVEGKVRWKFLRDERVFLERIPRDNELLETCLADVLPYPYGPYREIDWIEIPREQSTGVSEILGRAGQFVLQETDGGLRVLGYGW